MTNFKRGDRVVCVDGAFPPDQQVPYKAEDIAVPREGRTYTVREVVDTPRHGKGVRLMECQSPQLHHDIGGREEPCFSPARFRLAPASDEPIADREELSSLKAMVRGRLREERVAKVMRAALIAQEATDA